MHRQPYIIAEIGTAHGGELSRARELIAAAREAGADCAKFQVIQADEILHPRCGTISLPGGKTDLYSRFKDLEQAESFYFRIEEYCRSLGIDFLASPFGLQSADLLLRMGCRSVKIASPELNHLPLLRKTSGLHQILSSGVSKLSDIELALELCGPRTTLLHCVTNYPAREEEYNLNCIPHLSALFGVGVGVSDHSADPLLIPLCATSRGAQIIEKHICLSREGGGLDDPIALEPSDLSRLCREVGAFSRSGASVQLLYERFGSRRVDACLGDGRKRLSPGEAGFYRSTKRSILAVRDIQAGDLLSEENIALLRSETNLKPGLAGKHWDSILGRRAVRNIENGGAVDWELVAPRSL